MNSGEACIDHGQKGNRDGYGSSWLGGKTVGSHVAALIKETGEAPNGRYALHSCDNTRCINPKHLRWGTYLDNINDMHERGRARSGYPKGMKNGNSRLNDHQVSEIRTLFSSENLTRAQLAERFGVSSAHIGRILRNVAWRTVSDGSCRASE